jgi:predicted CoA-binding protein
VYIGREGTEVVVNETIRTVAVIGASRDRAKFGNKAVRAYQRAGWRVCPVNPRGDMIEGVPGYAAIADIPFKLDRVSLYLPPALGLAVLSEIARAAPAEFFVNPGADSPELLAEARALGLDPILACSIVEAGYMPEEFE